MGKGSKKPEKPEKKACAQVRKSALRKPQAASAKAKPDPAKSLLKASQKSKKEIKAKDKQKDIVAEVLRRAKASNQAPSPSTTASTPASSKEARAKAIAKVSKDGASKSTRTKEKEKKGQVAGQSQKDSTKKGDQPEKKAAKTKTAKESEGKDKEVTTTQASKKEEAKKREKELKKKLAQESIPPTAPQCKQAPTTPPCKRFRMKSPAGSVASSLQTDASAEHYAGKKARAEKAMAGMREQLEQAAADAQRTAELDGAGMLDLLNEMTVKEVSEIEKRQSSQPASLESLQKVADADQDEDCDDEEMMNFLLSTDEESGDASSKEEEATGEGGGEEESKEEDEEEQSDQGEDESSGEDDGEGDGQGEEEEKDEEEDDSSDDSDRSSAEEEEAVVEPKEGNSIPAGNATTPAATEDKTTDLAVVVAQTKEASQGVRNSATCKREWDKFDRQLKSGALPSSLAPYLKKKKQDIFALWLDHDEDWDQVAVAAERMHESKNLARKQWTAIQYKELEKTFDQTKLEEIVKKRTEQGLWYADEDFPTDPKETWYYMPQGRMVRQDDSTADQLRLTASKAATPELVNALTSDEGPLPNGALPAVKVASEQGTKNLFSALDDEGKAIVKPKKVKKPKDEAVEVTPKTWTEEAAAMVPQILDEATKARAKSIQLKGMDFAAELSSQLMKHGSEMESFYSSFKAAIEKPSPDRDEIKKLVKAIKVKRAWFEKAEASASGMIRGGGGKAKAKAKAKGKSKAEKASS